MNGFDIIFISETHTNGQFLPNVNGYEVISDPSFAVTTHGGMAAYVSSSRLVPHMTHLRFTKCSLSSSLSNIPYFYFMLVYIYSTDFINFLV